MAHYNLYGMKRRSQIKISILALVLAFAVTLGLNMLYSVSAAHTETVVVTGNTVDESLEENGSKGWWFGRDEDNVADFEFVNGVNSIGSGGLEIKPLGSTPANKFIGENFVWQPIADVNSISYDYQITGDGTPSDANEFYMNVYMNFGESADDKYYDCKYDVVPDVGTVGSFTTVTFDPTQSYPVTKGTQSWNQSPYDCPEKPMDMNSAQTGEGAYIRMFALNVGDVTAGDAGLGGYFDNVVLTTTEETTIYDFEALPASKDNCKKGSYADYGFTNQGLCIQAVNTGKDARNR